MRYRLVAILVALAVAAPLPALARPSAAAEQCFPETGFCVAGRFLDYWAAHGGLAINGYPISVERREVLEDGKEYLVQWFERVRLEHHPENSFPNDVLLGQFGRALRPPDPPVAATPGAAYFEATGHNVGPRFLAYWEAHGGLAQFGYPLSEEFWEILDDGGRYLVQYFERARLERHPENAPPYDVLLGQFGRRILAGGGSLTYTYDLGTFYQGDDAGKSRAGYTPSTGEYTTELLMSDTAWTLWSRVRTFADATVEVDARRGAGTNAGSYGLALRVQPMGASEAHNAHYDVAIWPGGQFAVFYNGAQEGQGKVIQKWADSAAIRLGDATNHLAVTLKGTTMTVAINGQVVGTYGDIAPVGGWVGFDTRTGKDPFTAAYRNLRVTYDVGPARPASAP